MRKPWFYVAGSCFVIAGLNFGFFIRDYLFWPLIPNEEKEPELAPAGFRYSLAGGTVLIASMCGAYFWYAPSRMVTRVTVYPATQMLGLRTAAPPPSRFLPASLRQRPFFQRAGALSPDDPRERLVPLASVFRLQGSAVGSEMNEWSELARAKQPVPPAVQARLREFHAATTKLDRQDTLMLRVGDARLAFQLHASPLRESLLREPPRGLRRMWLTLTKGHTDWSLEPGYTPSPAEHAEHVRRTSRGDADVEPWFLDRANFDQLFPLDATRYKRKA
ncbi:unnamed protein product [Malassezia sympodialis ATCC 42132]|nr:uncharacterized protein MSY001_3081 [Malassezia sympodialis ATCC 42132]CCV00376.1 unnamed protein product [Malassezia sympodialis ATCC 42132]|eukprot:XP_018741575.1 uncharacterized protein MSY001_3081 [Malassezia sympodialis ATCC 42132]